MKLSDVNIDWSFDSANTKYCTHGLHKYPARMIPQIPNNILNYYIHQGEIEKGSTLYDPFSGSGTSVVEARLHNLNAIGNDINPLACMISRSKSKRVVPVKLRSVWREYENKIKQDTQSIPTKVKNNEDLPEEPNVLDGWFPEVQLYQLASIRDNIEKIEDEFGSDISRIFKICLSEITRKTSYQRNGEFKRYRMSEEDRKNHDPDVWKLFKDSVNKNITKVSAFYSMTSKDQKTDIYNYDSRDIDILEDNSIDIVITSPPYGDHSTTVAYGQFSRDPAIVSERKTNETMRDVDKEGLGGKFNASISNLRNYSSTLDKTIDKLEEVDGRDEDALDFFKDYYAVMDEVNRVLKPNKPIAWVVGNRTMSRVSIPTHIITKELCEQLDMTFVENIPRGIPNKTMPLQNAPENISGVDGDLMSDENIVIMRSSE